VCVECREKNSQQEEKQKKMKTGTCSSCGRGVYINPKENNRCAFCVTQIKLAKEAGWTSEEAITAQIYEYVSTHKIYQGIRTANLIPWAGELAKRQDVKSEVNPDHHQVATSTMDDYIETLKAKYPATSHQVPAIEKICDSGEAILLPVTDRDIDLLRWVDELAADQRRTREQQVLWMLEVEKERAEVA